MPNLTSKALKPLVYWAIALLFTYHPSLALRAHSQARHWRRDCQNNCQNNCQNIFVCICCHFILDLQKFWIRFMHDSFPCMQYAKKTEPTFYFLSSCNEDLKISKRISNKDQYPFKLEQLVDKDTRINLLIYFSARRQQFLSHSHVRRYLCIH